MADARRLPGAGILTVLLFIALPMAATAWWLYRPRPDGPPPGPSLADLDVVCTGRVDGLLPSAALEPAVPGRVLKVEVAEGETVAAGQVLVRLDDAAAQLKVDEAVAAKSAAEVERSLAQTDAVLHPGRVGAMTAAVSAAAARAAAARKLQDQRVAQQSVTKATAVELAAGEAETRQAEQLAAAEDARLRELKAADPDLKVRAAAARVAAAEVAVKAARKAVDDCALKAPSAGVVLRVQTSAGEGVAPGSPRPPVVFRPAGPLVVRAELEQEFLGRVGPGVRAVVRDESRPDSPTWGGRLDKVSGWIARRRSVVLEPGELNDVRTAECLVVLDPPAAGLVVGQRVRVRFKRGE